MRVTVAIILQAVAEFRGVSVADLKGARRDQAITIPRFEACYLASELTGLSYPAIGRHIGNRDHSTILAAKRRMEERLTSYPVLRREMDDLRLLVRKAMGEAEVVQIMDARKIDPFEVAQRVLDADLPCTVVTSDEVRALAHFVAEAAAKTTTRFHIEETQYGRRNKRSWRAESLDRREGTHCSGSSRGATRADRR